MNLPKHVAIIMDGNGRWAKARGHNRYWGHIRGARAARRIIEHSTRIGLKHLTLFTFSTENWNRPEHEVNFLMKLLTRQLKKELPMLIKNNIIFRCVGNINRLPDHAQKTIVETIKATENNSGMELIFALNYSGRQDITQAVQAIAKKAKLGECELDNIDEAYINSHLDCSFAPDPDLVIRTSGEMRISNFFLWQAAYSEFYFCEKHWPDFSESDFDRALETFNNRERRFGKTSEQVVSQPETTV